MTRYRSSTSVIGALALCVSLLTTLVVGQDQSTREQQPNMTAAALMERAHDARAEWQDFRGFKADVVVSADTRRVNGSVVVAADGTVTLQLDDSELAEWAQEDLQSLVDHRLPSDNREYDVAFVPGERPNALGRLIRFNDDHMHSVYRVRHNVITEVHRTMGSGKLMINVVDVARTRERKILPRTYTVSRADLKTGKVSSMQVVNNRWVRIGSVDLPSRVLKIIHEEAGGRVVHEIRLSNHELLAAAN